MINSGEAHAIDWSTLIAFVFWPVRMAGGRATFDLDSSLSLHVGLLDTGRLLADVFVVLSEILELFKSYLRVRFPTPLAIRVVGASFFMGDF